MVDAANRPPDRTSPAECGLAGCRAGHRARQLPDHPFHIIVFDWDGTAVLNRQEDATPVGLRLARLLELGVDVVVVTGTNFPTIDRQLGQSIAGPLRRRLYICTNRGSEVYGFDAAGHPLLLWRRVATPEEDGLLTAVADEVRQIVERRTGLPIQVVANRLNRRKIDLIPLPEWTNPPKSEIGSLLSAVDRRLIHGGLPGGLREVFALTERIARDKGLLDARITSDGKHVEVGLTDKGDSIAWVMGHLATPGGVASRDILIVGDEFGPIRSFAGSDARMLIPPARGAVFASVGPEPNGVPPGVLHPGGGPACFRAILDAQIAALCQVPGPTSSATGADFSPEDVRHGPTPTELAVPSLLVPTGPTDPTWVLSGEEYVPAQEREVESLFAVANGYVGTRGSVREHRSLERPAVFVAGAFSELPSSAPELIIAPNWADVRVFVEGEELSVDRCAVLQDRRLLDLRRGIFEHVWRCRDHAGRITRIYSQRFASLADRHTLVELVTIVPENYSGRVRVDSVLDGQIATGPVSTGRIGGPRQDARSPLSLPPIACIVLTVPRTTPPPVSVAFAATSCFRSPAAVDSRSTTVEAERSVGESWAWDAEIGLAYRVGKLVSVFTSRDGPNPPDLAVRHLSRLISQGPDSLLARHTAAWAARWQAADVAIDGDDNAQRAIRFALYHLIAAVNPADEHVSIGARALTGEAYKGHVFWDTEIYMLPFFIHTHPPSARALLMYRYHTLPGARAKARALGFRGALYPWEATDRGEEATPAFALIPGGEAMRILTGEQEHHISAGVAYAVWQYWQATGDDEFLLQAGAEILLETARFWASRVQLGDDGHYHIANVIGPDEYHESVDDDAYTNGMARWNLERGVEVNQLLLDRWPDRWHVLADRLRIADKDGDTWSAIARKLYTGFDPATGLFEQFRGYFALENIDLAAYEPRTAPIDILLGPERVSRSQIIKQPDVVLLIYLLWDQFCPEVREVNFRYYEPRCAHGSSLSPSIHALMAACLGDVALAQRYFRQAAEIDLANNLGNAAGGVHAGALGGLWQSIVFGLAGMRVGDAGLAFAPRLLPTWRSLTFPVQWRNRRVRVTVSSEPRTIEVVLEQGDPLVVTLGEGGDVHATIDVGKRYDAEWRSGAWNGWREVGR